jgi:hypothetical protein
MNNEIIQLDIKGLKCDNFECDFIDMDINVEVGYEDGLDVDIQVELDVDQLSKADENEIVEEATDSALIEIDKLIEENFH